MNDSAAARSGSRVACATRSHVRITLSCRTHAPPGVAPPPAPPQKASSCGPRCSKRGAARRAVGALTLGRSTNKSYEYRVPVVDIVSWIISSFEPVDEVLFKIDVEGVEHEIFERLTQRGAWRLIDVLVFECHPPAGAGAHVLRADAVRRGGGTAPEILPGARLLPPLVLHQLDAERAALRGRRLAVEADEREDRRDVARVRAQAAGGDAIGEETRAGTGRNACDRIGEEARTQEHQLVRLI